MKKKVREEKIQTSYGTFETIFHSNVPERGYTVTAPRLKGMVTCGDTLNEARTMAREAIELHCECLIEEGFAELRIFEKIPPKQKVISR